MRRRILLSLASLAFAQTAAHGIVGCSSSDPPPTAPVQIGAAVTAYGQGAGGGLRIAHGVVRDITGCAGCTAPAYFTFSNGGRGEDDAGPGFSGGPVLDASGRLIGIIFGYKDIGRSRMMYAYDMSRVMAELSAITKSPK